MPNRADNIIEKIRLVLVSSDFKERHRKKDTAFIRNRVLSFVELIVIQINRLVLSLSVELDNFLNLLNTSNSYSKQAFSKARQLFSYSAFVELNEVCVKEFYINYEHKKLKNKYLLLAVDGSLCQLPESEEIASHFQRWKNHLPKGGMPMARISILFDVLNEVVIDACFSPNNRGEITLLNEHLEQTKEVLAQVKNPFIYLMDRGYPSFEIMDKIKKSKHFYVIRCKSSYRKEIIDFVKRDLDEDNLILTNRDKILKTRIVRIRLKSNQYEYLLTNTDFTIEELSEIYFKRWGVETFYGYLKGSLQLENFSSKTKEGVLQDFHVSILTANLANLLIQEAQNQIDNSQINSKKYKYKVNKNVALGIVKNNIPKILMSEDLSKVTEAIVKKIKRHKVYIKPGRKFERKRQKRTKRKYHMHQKRAF